MDAQAFMPALRCSFFGLGIVTMLGVYGFIQEKVMSVPYDGELFKASVFLVLMNRLYAIAFSGVMIKTQAEDASPKCALWKYFAISISNVAATTCQYEALKWVSFPTQMLGKSFKMMPVMLWGIVISQKSYGIKDWLIAAFVTFGVTEFLMTGQISAAHSSQADSVYGLGLLLGFLAFDGFTSTFQEKLFKDHATTKYNQMLYINLFSAITSALSLFVFGGFSEAIAFCIAHPRLMVDASILSAGAVGGQFFIYSMVKEFGALAFAATMNVRQVVSIILSYIIYSKPITFLQILGLMAVFGALFYKSYDGFQGAQEKEKQKLLQEGKSEA
jgi:adenosine 3'-phospho 5'-phosphosulfate transporter B2